MPFKGDENMLEDYSKRAILGGDDDDEDPVKVAKPVSKPK